MASRASGQASHGVWFVNEANGPTDGWRPLWQRDSRRLEERYLSGEHQIEVPVRHKHGMANINKRTIVESYFKSPKSEELRRGTWFWESTSGHWIPFPEETAVAVTLWDQAVRMSTSSSEGRWEHDLGEVLGKGNGQFTIVARLLRADIDAKGTKRDVEVVSSESTAEEIRAAMSDESNRLEYTLENRTSLLHSFVSRSVRVQNGFKLEPHPDEREDDFPPVHLVFVVHGIGEAMFAQPNSPAPSIQTCVQKFKRMSLESTHPSVAEMSPVAISNVKEGMVEYIAIEWWDSVHGEDKAISQQMQRITAPTVPLMRQFGNTAAMDILVIENAFLYEQPPSYMIL